MQPWPSSKVEDGNRSNLDSNPNNVQGHFVQQFWFLKFSLLRILIAYGIQCAKPTKQGDQAVNAHATGRRRIITVTTYYNTICCFYVLLRLQLLNIITISTMMHYYKLTHIIT